MSYLSCLSLCWLLLGLSSIPVISQPHAETHPTEAHQETGIWEVIGTGIYSYTFGEGEALGGTEFHLTYWQTHMYGGGLSYTARFAPEEVLNDIALLASWNPIRWLTINAGPNFALPGVHRSFLLGAYAETEINWRFHEHFHLGPIIGTVISKHTEGTIGLHFGVEW